MRIESPDTDDAEAIADQWVALAREQRAFGSHLLAEANRATIRDAIVRHIVAGELLVARVDGDETNADAANTAVANTDDSNAETTDTNEIVGFVMFGPEGDRYRQDVSRGIVRNVVVTPDRRNEGIGAALLAAAESALHESGFEAVGLSVLADNDAARRFYRRAGYTPHRIDLEKRLESDTDKPEEG
ncbi:MULTISPECIES: GNAT family N-acetyltransferase [Halococcus]|uniref:Sporulation regulator-like protein n=1 Tax=Halococcus salifodinae DSM 8989 TaxID=1227456 RepID=M0N897_9EURY|nr:MULTISPECIES: GNAT family N-acetyltransferase [Halococcus]EMA53334.1 sporulation regulator-like protein [Halococcus salifodinae DSM 8989]